MIRLKYLSGKDGWAVIEDHEETRLIRPPYKKSSAVELTENSLFRLLDTGYFQKSTDKFQDYRSLIGHINKVVATERGSDLDYSSLEITYRLIASSSERDLDRQIDIINKNMGRSVAEDIAEKLAVAIISRAKDLKVDRIINEGLSIINDAVDARSKKSLIIDIERNITQDFPLASSRYGESVLEKLSMTIAKRRSMFGFTPVALAA
jgi:hypothetical protein